MAQISAAERKRQALNRRIRALNMRQGEVVIEPVRKGERITQTKRLLERERAREEKAKADKRLEAKIREYNETKKTERSKIRYKTVEHLTQKQKDELKKVLAGNKKKTAKEVAEVLSEQAKQYPRLKDVYGEAKPKGKSAAGLSTFIENSRRLAAGLDTIQDEIYYQNLLRGAARVGAWTVYNRFKKGGIRYAIDMYLAGFDLGFEIYETVPEGDDSVMPTYMADDETDAAIKQHESMRRGKRDTPYGQKVLRKLKRAEGLHKSNLRG